MDKPAYLTLEAERDEFKIKADELDRIRSCHHSFHRLGGIGDCPECNEKEKLKAELERAKDEIESMREMFLFGQQCYQAIEGVLTYDPMVDICKLKQFFGYTLKPTQAEARAALEGEK